MKLALQGCEAEQCYLCPSTMSWAGMQQATSLQQQHYYCKLYAVLGIRPLIHHPSLLDYPLHEIRIHIMTKLRPTYD